MKVKCFHRTCHILVFSFIFIIIIILTQWRDPHRYWMKAIIAHARFPATQVGRSCSDSRALIVIFLAVVVVAWLLKIYSHKNYAMSGQEAGPFGWFWSFVKIKVIPDPPLFASGGLFESFVKRNRLSGLPLIKKAIKQIRITWEKQNFWHESFPYREAHKRIFATDHPSG